MLVASICLLLDWPMIEDVTCDFWRCWFDSLSPSTSAPIPPPHTAPQPLHLSMDHCNSPPQPSFNPQKPSHYETLSTTLLLTRRTLENASHALRIPHTRLALLTSDLAPPTEEERFYTDLLHVMVRYPGMRDVEAMSEELERKLAVARGGRRGEVEEAFERAGRLAAEVEARCSERRYGLSDACRRLRGAGRG